MIKKNLQLKFLKDLQDFLFRNSLFNDILQITLSQFLGFSSSGTNGQTVRL